MVGLQAGQAGAALTEQPEQKSAVLAWLEGAGQHDVAARPEMFPHEDVGGLDVVTGSAVLLGLSNHGVQPVFPVRLHLQHVETDHQLGPITEISNSKSLWITFCNL